MVIAFDRLAAADGLPACLAMKLNAFISSPTWCRNIALPELEMGGVLSASFDVIA